MTGDRKKSSKNVAEPRAAGAGTGMELGEADLSAGGYSPARMRGGAWMRVFSAYLIYHPGLAAAEVLMVWKHAFIEFVIDGETQKPRALRLTRPQAGQFAYKVRLGSRRRPYLSIPTSVVGWAPASDPRAVEETVSENEIVVSLPFEFK